MDEYHPSLARELLDKANRNIGVENCAVAFLCDLQAVKKTLYVGIGSLGPNVVLQRAKDAEKRAQRVGDLARVFFRRCQRLCF